MQSRFKRSKLAKLLSMALCASFLLALVGCNQGEESSTAPEPAPSTPDYVEPEVEEPINAAFLTGLEKGSEYPEGQRMLAVMVNNIAGSRPTRGLSDAQIIVEIKVEGGITRFMALYEDYEKVPEIGSVRSARDQFFQLILPYWAFYVHDGQSTVQRQYFIDWEYEEFNLDTGIYGGSTQDKTNLSSLAWRDAARVNAGYKSEYTEYTDGSHIAATIANNKLDDRRDYNSTFFDFVPYTDAARVPDGGSTNEVAIVHSASYRTLFQYDESTGLYNMSQYNSSRGGVEATVDENNGEQVAFDNVLVLFAPMSIYPGTDGLVKVEYYGGAGYLFTQGGYEVVIWNKGGPNERLYLTKLGADEPVLLNPGTTYLAIVDDTELENFDATLKAGTGGEEAAAGTVNANENDGD